MINSITSKHTLKEIEKRRQQALFVLSQHENEVFAKIPRAKELTLQIANTCIQLSNAVFSGGDNCAQLIEKIKQTNLSYQRELELLLEHSGYSKEYLNAQYTCMLCNDTGYVLGKQCECLKRLLIERNIEEFNKESRTDAPQCFENFSLSYYSDAAAKESGLSPRRVMQDIYGNCRAYAAHFSPQAKSILMLGGTGLGKTHLSLAIAGEVVKNGFTVIYVSAPDLFRKLQNEYYGRGEAGVDTMDLLQRADLLILDDLGAEIENQFAASALYNIINSRLNCHKPSIINTNLTLKEIEKRYSDRVASRLMTLFRCLKFIGKDIRQQKLKEG